MHRVGVELRAKSDKNMHELRDFELEIIQNFAVMGRRAPRVGVWIRGHLLDVTYDYLYGMWKRYNEFVKRAQEVGVKMETVTYRNFRTYAYFLKKLNLIRYATFEEVASFFGTYPKQKKGKPRRYFTVVEENLDHEAWFDPVGYYISGGGT